MPTLSNAVFDAALDFIATCTEANVKDGASVLVDSIVLDGSNFGAPGDYTSGSTTGRKMTALVSASDMLSIAVTGSGSADTVALLDGSAAVHVVASISGADVSLTSTDKVNLGTFSIILVDPT